MTARIQVLGVPHSEGDPCYLLVIDNAPKDLSATFPQPGGCAGVLVFEDQVDVVDS